MGIVEGGVSVVFVVNIFYFFEFSYFWVKCVCFDVEILMCVVKLDSKWFCCELSYFVGDGEVKI